VIEEKSKLLRRTLILLDLGLTLVMFLASFGLRQLVQPGQNADFLSHLALLPAILGTWIVLLVFFGAYRSPRGTGFLVYASAVVHGVATGFAVLLTLLFVLKIQYVSRMILGTFVFLDVLGLLGVRLWAVWYFRRSLQRGQNFGRVLVIGSGPRAKRLIEALIRNAEWGIHIIGLLDPDPARQGALVLGAPVLGTLAEIGNVLKRHVVDEVILAIPRSLLSDVERIALACEEEGVKLLMMADVFNTHVARMQLVQYSHIPLLTFEPVAPEEWALVLKRLIDVALAALMLPVLLPIMGLVALAVKLDSRGPVLFVQTRVGLNKRRFRMLKFRTMQDGAERMLAKIEHLNEARGPIFKIAHDPRITRIGRVLRKTSLDELPQIFNVLKGEMSLVGPRPMSLRDVDLFDRGIQRKRFSMKPGITCLWQVSGRSQLPFSKWLELDLTYIEKWSLGLDLKILFKTIPAVLKGSGAV
jgi:exopolysaccharide biosynthesis polyprenyl glycosylphosphotransferase